MRIRTIGGLLTLLIALSFTGAAAQRDYPTRSIDVILGFAPGGPLTALMNVLKPRLDQHLGQPIVPVYKAGAGGALAMGFVASAKPDGYTVVASSPSSLTVAPTVRPDITYQISDFSVIGTYARDPGILVANAESGWKTWEDFLQHAKANPGNVAFGSPGKGSGTALSVEGLKLVHKLDMRHVPFQGSGQVRTAILGKHIQVGTAGMSVMIPHIKAGTVRPLLITSAKRDPRFPDVPTMAEKGVGFDTSFADLVFTFHAPAQTPKSVIDTWAKALDKTMHEPAVVEAFDKIGILVDYQSPEATAETILREQALVRDLVKGRGLGLW